MCVCVRAMDKIFFEITRMRFRCSHGTRCAGEVAAIANNSNCCVGIAYEAKIGGRS